jgi:hypothetical protein
MPTLEMVINVCLLYTYQRKLDKAEDIYERASKVREKFFCYDHQRCHRRRCPLSTLEDLSEMVELDLRSDIFIVPISANCQPQCNSCAAKIPLPVVRLT